MSELTEVFVDGVHQIHFTGGYARLDFMTLDSNDGGATLQQKPNLRVIMDTQQMVTLRDTLSSLIQKMQENHILPNPNRGQTLEERYNPGIFSVPDIEAAKSIILTKEGQDGPEERWQKETPALMSMLNKTWRLGPGVTVVDYGCGIGRIAKELCVLGCKVVGVDISPEMRKLTVEYVNNANFSVISPEGFVSMINNGFTCDYACAIWVLQHCLKPDQDLNNICRALMIGGELFVVNNKYSRAVPVIDRYWQDDRIDIWQLCGSRLKETRILGFPEGVGIDARHFQCGFYQKI